MIQTPSTPALFDGLAQRIAAGDTEAEAALFSHVRGGVFAMLLSRTHDIEAARDLTQDVMLAVLHALRSGLVRGDSSLAAFVHGTARNLVNKHIHGLVQARRPILVPVEPVPTDPEEAFAFCEKVQLVHRAIARLGSTDRAILTLTLDEGLSPAEISERLGIPGAVVRERKSRAVRRISERLRRTLRKGGAARLTT